MTRPRPGRLWLALLALAAGLAVAPAARAESAPPGLITVGNFSAGDLSGWEPKEFEGRTRYSLVQDQGRTVLRAEADRSASGLVKTLRVDPRRQPILRWSWKVEGVLARGDARIKAGDDYAARVYVVFPSALFWRTRAINYIWANRLPQGQAIPNAFTKNAMLVAVESGPAKAGQWLSEERDIRADFQALFGEEAPELGAVAVMTDADNTQDRAVAWYGDIFLAPAPSAPSP